MFQSHTTRFLIGAPLASIIVLGLMSFMSAAIAAEFTHPTEVERRPLDPIQRPTDELPEPKPDLDEFRPENAVTPPELPPLTAPDMGDAEVIIITAPQPTGDLPNGRLDGLELGPTPFIERVAKAMIAPQPDYPDRALRQGVSGTCEVRFSLMSTGIPFDVVATCSDRVFEGEARRSVERARFVPEVREGEQVESHGLVYPLEFTIQE